MSTGNRFSLFPKRNKETWTVSRYVVIEQSYNSPSSSGFYNEMEKHLPMRRFKLLIPDSSELVSPGISPKFLGICSFDKSPSSSGTRRKKQKKKKRGRWTKLFHTRLFSPPQITRRPRKYVSTFWLRGLHTFVNPLTDLRRCLRDSSSTLSSLFLSRALLSPLSRKEDLWATKRFHGI